MRLVSFVGPQGPTLGVRLGKEIVDCQVPPDLRPVFDGGTDVLKAIDGASHGVTSRFDGETVTRLPLVHNANKIVCLGLNYHDHAMETGLKATTYPAIFLRTASSLVAHGMPIVRPRNSVQFDYEGELVAFVGRRARHVSQSEALEFIAGYSIFNDGSIRDYQLRTSQWTLGKNFDRTGSIGPEFVSADELPPGASGLRLQTRLNGEIVQDANTKDMTFDVATTLVIVSACMTLEPGDLLVMGTPSGVGMSRKPPLWMVPGDVCEVEIERLGTLRNTVEADAQ